MTMVFGAFMLVMLIWTLVLTSDIEDQEKAKLVRSIAAMNEARKLEFDQRYTKLRKDDETPSEFIVRDAGEKKVIREDKEKMEALKALGMMAAVATGVVVLVAGAVVIGSVLTPNRLHTAAWYSVMRDRRRK